MIKLTYEIFMNNDFGMGLASLEGYKLPQGKLLYNLAKILRRLNIHFKEFRTKYLALKQKYAVTELTAAPPEFLAELKSLNETSFTIDCHPIDLGDFPELKLSSAEYIAIEPIISNQPLCASPEVAHLNTPSSGQRLTQVP